MRSLRSNLRQARIQSAVVANMGANAGTSGSSGVIGGQGSIQSQSASNVGFFNQTQELNGDIYETQVDQANAAQAYGKAQGSSAMWGAIGNLGGSMFSAGGGFKTIFDGPTKP